MSWAAIANLLQAYWIIPFGMVALIYYGWFHFNTPDYAVNLIAEKETPNIEYARLISLAPPMFTTTRAQFSRYALRYILLLEVLFLVAVLFPHILASVSKIFGQKAQLPLDENPEYRGLWALFVLTGLLSSLPGLKDIDAWILKKLQQAALIPDDVRYRAERIRNARFEPRPKTLAAVKEDLKMRDTRRVAVGQAEGRLESTLIEVLCLRKELLNPDAIHRRYIKFRSKLERDFAEINNVLRDEFISYFEDQEKVIPLKVKSPEGKEIDVTNIDDYIKTHSATAGIKHLNQRRQELQAKCDALFERACLIVALYLYATETSPEAVDGRLKRIGFFDIEPQTKTIVDGEAVAVVVLIAFLCLAGFNLLFVALVKALDIEAALNFPPDFLHIRDRILSFSLADVFVYFVVMWAAMRLKRRWHGSSKPFPRRRGIQNFVLSILSYAVAVIVYTLFYGSISKIIFALWFSLDVAILGYFIGLYIDRRAQGRPLSYIIAVCQALLQFLVAFAAGFFSAPYQSFAQVCSVSLLSAAGSAILGFVVAIIFQRLYRRTKLKVGDPAQPLETSGHEPHSNHC